MYPRRFILGAAAAAPMLMAAAGTAWADAVTADAAKAFITQSGQQLVDIVNNTPDATQKAAALRQLVNRIVAVDQVGDYVLGRYIHIATPAQHQQFETLFHQLLAYNITYQINAYQGVGFVVNGVTPQGDDMVVNTTITTQNKPPADVGWVVAEVDGQPKIIDVIVAGTSLRVTTRNDYASVIIDNGGQVSALLAAMQKRIDTLSASQ